MNGKWTLQLLASAWMLPLAMAVAWAAGAMSARRLLRRELERARRPERPAAPSRPEPVSAPAPPPSPAPQPVKEEVLDDATLAVLSAAVAAFFGKTARIRRARLIAGAPISSAWAQQGRVYVQGSHNLGLRPRP